MHGMLSRAFRFLRFAFYSSAGGVRFPLPWIAAILALSGGCMIVGRGVNLSYEPAKNIVRSPRRTPIQMVAFEDKRDDRRWIGRAPLLIPGFRAPLRPRSDVASWATQAAASELLAMGYAVASAADWKLGGAVKEVRCAGRRKPSCSVKLETWVQMKDNWRVFDREYVGEGSMPPLIPEADIYELSLQDAMRDLLANFRRDFELAAP